MREARQLNPVIKYHHVKSEGVILAAFFPSEQEGVAQRSVAEHHNVSHLD
jgi:hypothetical protein